MKNFQHVFIIMMENTGFNTLIGNSNAPFINAAASNYGLATNYFGVTHPSQPNYIAATSLPAGPPTARTVSPRRVSISCHQDRSKDWPGAIVCHLSRLPVPYAWAVEE
jgi:hypothetical protein